MYKSKLLQINTKNKIKRKGELVLINSKFKIKK